MTWTVCKGLLLHDLRRKEAEQCLIRRQLGFHNTQYKFNSLVSTCVNSPFANHAAYRKGGGFNMTNHTGER